MSVLDRQAAAEAATEAVADATADPAVAAPGPAALRLDGVGKVWPDGTAAVDRIDLTLRRGDLVALVGPSGCGKSTVLRMAAGLDDPTAGTIDRAGALPGCVFQEPNLLPWRSVLRNVELFAELDGADRAGRRARAADAVRQVGLAGFEDHLPHQLSGGMQMRAALARALVTRPEVLLFDEPFAAVDELRREQLGEELTRIFHREPFAGLFITHSVAEAVLLSTEVRVMSARPGRVVGRFAVPFAYPRSPDLRFDPGFVDLAREVSATLRDAAAAASEASEAEAAAGTEPADDQAPDSPAVGRPRRWRHRDRRRGGAS